MTLINVIAESGQFLYLVRVFPDQDDTKKNKTSF